MSLVTQARTACKHRKLVRSCRRRTMATRSTKSLSITELLKPLASASQLSDFVVQRARLCMLHDILEDRLYREPKHKENEVLFSGGVVDALFAATCNALKLLNSSWSAAADKHLHAVSLLCQPLYRCSTVWIQVSAHKDAVATKLATLAVRTGWLSAVPPIGRRLGSALQQLQQSTVQTPLQQFDTPLLLITSRSMLSLWANLFDIWPGDAMSNKTMAATIDPVARCALVLLGINPQVMTSVPGADAAQGVIEHSSAGHPAHIRYDGGGGSGTDRDSHVSSVHKPQASIAGYVGKVKAATKPDASSHAIGGLIVAAALAAKRSVWDSASSNSSSSSSTNSGQQRPNTVSPEVQQLLVMFLAHEVAGLQLRRPLTAAAAAATSGANGQKQQHHAVPRYHEKLLAVLGVPYASMTEYVCQQNSKINAARGATHLCRVVQAALAVLVHPFQQWRQQQQQQWGQSITPTLLTVLELVKLQDQSNVLQMGQFVHLFTYGVSALQSPLLNRNSYSSDRAQLIRVLLLGVWPGMLAAQDHDMAADRQKPSKAASSSSSRSESISEADEAWQSLLNKWGLGVGLLASRVDEGLLAAIIDEHTQLSLAALEAAVRNL